MCLVRLISKNCSENKYFSINDCSFYYYYFQSKFAGIVAKPIDSYCLMSGQIQATKFLFIQTIAKHSFVSYVMTPIFKILPFFTCTTNHSDT